MVKNGRLMSLFRSRTDHKGRNVSAAMLLIRVYRFIISDDEQPVLSKGRAREQRINMSLEPIVSKCQFVGIGAGRNRRRTIVRIAVLVRNYKSVLRQLIVSQISSKLRKWDDIVSLRLTAEHISNVSERIVTLDVRILISTGVAD